MRLKEIYNITEVAEALKCTRKTVRKYIDQGRIKTILFGRNHKVTEAELKHILKYGLPTGANARWRKKAAAARKKSRANAKAREAAALASGGQASPSAAASSKVMASSKVKKGGAASKSRSSAR